MTLSRRTMMTTLAAAAVPLVASQARAASPWAGMQFLDADGRAFGLDDIRKPLTLVKLWASWCSACAGEMASLGAMARALGPDAIQVLLVSHPEYWARDRQVARARALPFTLATPGPATPQAAVRSLLLDQDGMFMVPRSVLFTQGRDGVAWTHLGSMDWAAPGVIADLKGRIG